MSVGLIYNALEIPSSDLVSREKILDVLNSLGIYFRTKNNNLYTFSTPISSKKASELESRLLLLEVKEYEIKGNFKIE